MNYNEIIKLNGKKVSIDTFERIEESVYVESVECLGDSGIYYGYTWYSVVLSPAYEMSGNIIIDVYLKNYDTNC